MIHTSALCIRPQWAALIWDHKKRLEIRSYSIKIESCVWVPVIESGASLVTGLVQFLGIVENREGWLALCIVLLCSYLKNRSVWIQSLANEILLESLSDRAPQVFILLLPQVWWSQGLHWRALCATGQKVFSEWFQRELKNGFELDYFLGQLIFE